MITDHAAHGHVPKQPFALPSPTPYLWSGILLNPKKIKADAKINQLYANE